MIYPEKKKLDETLSHPYDKLFTYANNIIGNEVKYLITSGYSFRDEHINDRLLLPKLKNGSLRIFALLEKELDSINVFKDCPSFNYLTMNSLHLNGKIYELENSLWKFSELVKFITE